MPSLPQLCSNTIPTHNLNPSLLSSSSYHCPALHKHYLRARAPSDKAQMSTWDRARDGKMSRLNCFKRYFEHFSQSHLFTRCHFASKHIFDRQNVTIKWVCHIILVSRLVLVFHTALDVIARLQRQAIQWQSSAQ